MNPRTTTPGKNSQNVLNFNCIGWHADPYAESENTNKTIIVWGQILVNEYQIKDAPYSRNEQLQEILEKF